MTEVAFKDWKPGLKKVSLTKLFQQEAGLSLSEAKKNTDRLLDGEIVTVRLSSTRRAQELADAAGRLGAVAEVRSSRLV